MCGNNQTQLLHQVAVPTKMLGLEQQYDNVSNAGAISPKKKRRVAPKKDIENEIVSNTAVVPMVAPMVPPMMMQQQQYSYPAAAYGMPPMVMNPFGMPMMMMPPPMYAQQGRKQQQEYCCLPYLRYITSKKPRVGRPPHDPFTCVKLNLYGKAPHK